ncbi:hypothetical protein FBU30_003261 [Linnemannia zychae]|nr:hypothetical protein FBU30_003261 [Linnemannia zychae]
MTKRLSALAASQKKTFNESLKELSVNLMEHLSKLQLPDGSMEIYNASNIEVDDQASGGDGDEDGGTIGA